MKNIKTTRHAAERWGDETEDEQLFWPCALWIDPGVVTGVAAVWFDPARLINPDTPVNHAVLAWDAWMLHGGENYQVNVLVKTISALTSEVSHLTVGIESFIIRQMNMSAAFLSPVRIRAALEFAAWKGIKSSEGSSHTHLVHTQTPSDAKNVVTDARLNAWGFWTPGPDHARDATRHALLYLRKLRAGGRAAVVRNHGGADEEMWWQL